MGQDSYREDNVQSKTGILILKYPMEQGIITYWEHMKSDTLLMIVDNEKYNQLCCPLGAPKGADPQSQLQEDYSDHV